MFGTTLIEHSALTNSLPEKSQGMAEAVTCRIEQKCQQEEKKKARKKGDGASDLFQERYPINELSVAIKLGQGGKTRLVLSLCLALMLTATSDRMRSWPELQS